MGKAIASRTAAAKLIWIVAVLIVPLLVLGAMLVRALEKDMAVTAREQIGATYVRLAMPVFLGAFEGRRNEEAIRSFSQEASPIAARLELAAAHGALIRLLEAERPNHAAVLAQGRELVRLAGERSGLILDSFTETYYLAYLTTVTTPALVSEFGRIERLSASGGGATKSDDDRLIEINMSIGAWRASLEQMHMALRAATTAAPYDLFYKDVNEDMIEFASHASGLVDAARAPHASAQQRRASIEAITASLRQLFSEDIRHMWGEFQTQLEASLAQRHSAMGKQMFTMVGIALFAALLGLASAIRMFQSTLKRLDEVEEARNQADTARHEAEAMADRLEDINNDVVKLNLELTANVSKLHNAQEELLKKGRLAHLGQLTATVAHELRNPLGAVRTSAFLLERKTKGKGLGVEAQLQRISNGINRCDNIITQLLDFSRASTPVLVPTDLDAWLLKIIEDEAEGMPTNVRIEFTAGLDGRSVGIDSGRLSRAIINLLSNAAEAMVGKGEEQAAKTTADPHILVETRLAARGCEISVRDNGPGISADVLPRILEPLFTTKNFGTGLGLPAVQRIMEQHGGGLDVVSEPGQGACFTLWVPAVSESSEAA